MRRALIRLRCKLALWILRRKFDKRYAIANLICPSTGAIVRAAPGRAPRIPLPACSHIFYHQASVEQECAWNSFQTVLWNVPPEDEVILYDKGGTLPPRFFEALARQRWRSWAVHAEATPEMASYTYGMNHSLPMAQAPIVMVWRSDYVYPRGLYASYQQRLPGHDIVLPYEVVIGGSQVTAEFVTRHWDKLDPYDAGFWRKNADSMYSIYECQDPVHFAVRRELWQRLGGLDHRLWGYGWQFGEFAARLHRRVPARKIKYFDCPPPVHMNHASSLMVRSKDFTARKGEEDRIGRERFAAFLGGQDLFECYHYRWSQKLPPLSPADRA